MKPKHSLTAIAGVMTGTAFLGLAIWLSFAMAGVAGVHESDLYLYSLLTGSYGVWRIFRSWRLWNGAQENA
ncbi:MAG: hypothetical protein A3K90_07515 [Pelodictyon luteolum]|uniref:Uncharacterized protein n=1 Tax=Pelodictyon luteolum TaxID=1100 RepID=A0A165LHP8_PELLU|nr:hypothetical protein [Pelodictyon luteolum]KZK74058.1 MAG: hypothetical protein A3K90_07515 [Pelodictyon luteolum]